MLLGLGVSADTTVVSSEGNGLLVTNHILKESDCLSVTQTTDRGSSFPGVFEVHTEIGTPGLGG